MITLCAIYILAVGLLVDTPVLLALHFIVSISITVFINRRKASIRLLHLLASICVLVPTGMLLTLTHNVVVVVALSVVSTVAYIATFNYLLTTALGVINFVWGNTQEYLST